MSIPDYNTEVVPRVRRKFNPFRPPKEASGYYSAFYPLLVVFLSFIVLLLYEVSILRVREAELTQKNNRFAAIIEKQKWQPGFIEALHHDLKGLAPTHPAAAAMLKDFFPDPAATPETGGILTAPTPTPTPSS